MNMYNFQKQNSTQTLQEGLEEFYSINTEFRELSEKTDNPNAKIFKEHDYTHVLFGLGTSIEEESLLDSFVIWGTKFNVKQVFNFYKDPEYSTVISNIIAKYGGRWSVAKIYLSLLPLKFKIFLRCMKMKKRWNYHDIPKDVLNTSLKDIRSEYNIDILSYKDVPVGRYLANNN